MGYGIDLPRQAGIDVDAVDGAVETRVPGELGRSAYRVLQYSPARAESLAEWILICADVVDRTPDLSAMHSLHHCSSPFCFRKPTTRSASFMRASYSFSG